MRELYNFQVVVPAGTLKTAPQTFNLILPPRNVVEIEVLVPPGPRGEVGFKVAQAGAQILPSAAGDFIVTDDETIHWPLEGANTSGAWQVIAYNTGGFAHTLEFRFQVNLPASQEQAAGVVGAASPVIPATPEELATLAPAPLPVPVLALPPPPATAPPGVPVAPASPSLPGPQAPPLPGLPSPPALPPLPTLPGASSAEAALNAAEAREHSIQEGQAAAANQAALLVELEAIAANLRQQVLHPPAAGPPPPAPTKILI